jgi:predicted tellurium resistance membrane protein TerC
MGQDVYIFFARLLQILFLDLALSGDNVGVIALVVRSLEPRQALVARKALDQSLSLI